jgi:NDP-sugar pyrophosphorylase family protein
MELIINQLHRAGIRRVTVATYYQPEKIKDHFGDGRTFGVEIEYLTEETPLGTAGALGLLDDPQEPLLVINGDLLTQIDFRAMMAFHHEQAAGLTIAVRHYDLQVPYGVLDCEGPSVRRVREKPMLQFVVNAGIYLLEPWALQYIPRGQRFDMTHLIESLLENERPVASFPVLEYWLDIGQHADYEQAQKDMQDGKRGLGAGGRS